MKGSRSLFSVAAAAFLSLALAAGCGDDDTASPAPVVVDDKPGPTLTIGLLLPDPDDNFGAATREAADIARATINTADGNVAFVYREGDHADDETVLQAARDFRSMGVNGIVGPAYSSRGQAIFDFVNENRLVTVSHSATSVYFSDENKKLVDAGEPHYFFRTAPSDIYQAQVIEGLAEGSVLIVYRNDNWGMNLQRLIGENMSANGREAPMTVAYEPYDWDDADAAAKASKVVTDVESVSGLAEVDSIIMIVFEEGGGIINGMLASDDVPDDAQYYLGDGLAAKNLYEFVDENDPSKVEGFKATTPYEHSDPLERDIRFQTLFEDEEDDFPSLEFTTHIYDAVVTIALAALAAGSADPEVYVSEMENVTKGGTKCRTYAVCASLLNVGVDIDYQGLSGPIDFDRYGDVTEGYYAVYTYDAAKCRAAEVVDFELREVEAPVLSRSQRCAP